MRTKGNFYSGLGLDRLGAARADEPAMARILADPATRFLPVWRSRSLVVGEPARAAFLNKDEMTLLLPQASAPILLGQAEGRHYIALDVSRLALPEHAPALATHGAFVDLRSVGPLLPRAEGSLLAYARGMTHWQGRHLFCGLCGWATRSVQAGHVQQCSNPACGADHFPRTDPAVIMLVHDGGDRCLLGRQASWPVGMHSTLAGFVEPGESLEEAVAREVLEEVGVEVEEVTYHSSQPWPFPSSLMLGFWARAKGKSISLNDKEIAQAAWYSRAALHESPENETFKLPRRDSIARALIEDWMKLS